MQDFDRRMAEYQSAAARVQAAIETIVKTEFPALLEKLPEGEALRASVNYSYGGYLDGKTQMILSVRQEGKTDIWQAGKTVPLSSNDAYTLSPRHGGEYTVEPRRDTYAGKALAAIMDALPKTPVLSDYPQLHADFTFYPNRFEAAFGISGKVPFARKFGNNTILVYNTEDTETGEFTPPGATPLPLKAYKWLEADEQDRNMGITPPPMPNEIRALPWGTPPLKPPGGTPKP